MFKLSFWSRNCFMTSSIHQIFFGSTSWIYRVLSNLLQSRGGSGGTSEPKILISRNSLLDLQRNPSLVKKDPLLIYPKWLQLPSILVDNDIQRWEITPKASPKSLETRPGQVLSTRVAFLTICVSWCVEKMAHLDKCNCNVIFKKSTPANYMVQLNHVLVKLIATS